MDDNGIAVVSSLLFIITLATITLLVRDKEMIVRVSSGFSMGIVVAIISTLLLHMVFPNKAAPVFRRLQDQITELNPTVLCSFSHRGQNAGSNRSSYSAYLAVDADADPEKDLVEHLATEDFYLTADENYPEEKKEPQNTYMSTTDEHGYTVDLRIYRVGNHENDCSKHAPQEVPAGQMVVYLAVYAPDTPLKYQITYHGL